MSFALESMISLAVARVEIMFAEARVEILLAITRMDRVELSSTNTPNAEASTMMRLSINTMRRLSEKLVMNIIAIARRTLLMNNGVFSITRRTFVIIN